MLAHDCNPEHLYDVITKERGFIRTLKASAILDQDIKDAIKGEYVPISNKKTLELAKGIIQKDREAAITMVLGDKEPTAVTYAVGQELLRQLQQGDDASITKAISIAEHLADKATQQGQAIQALSMWNRLTPEGALKYAGKVAKRNNTKVTPDKARRITDIARELRDIKNKNERDVKTAELLSEIQQLEKPSLGKKIGALQAMGQLLNPKTAIRNVLGNTLFAGVDTSSKALASVLDTALSQVTGKRTVVMPQLKAMASGAQRGAKAGLNDALKGIDTSRQGSKFDLPKGKTFENPILQKLETALDIELKASDRAFYEMAYRESLLNQVKASAKSKDYNGRARITPDMVATAHQDALYKTFQDDSAAAKLFTGVKQALNLKQDFGLGDFVLKYPKTPGNLLSRAFAYSPAGYLKAFYEIGKPFIDRSANVPFNQKNFVESFARATTGTVGIGAMGYTLGKLGLATGEYGADKDIESVKKLEGIGPYRLNATGLLRYATTLNPEAAQPQKEDMWVTYDWAQPMAVPLAAAVNIAVKGDNTKAVDVATQTAQGVFEGAETLTQQNVVKGLQDLFSVRDDEGKTNIIAGVESVAANAPSSFVPTIFSQANQMLDNNVRDTYSQNMSEQVVNKVKAKIPGLAQTLPVRYDVYGQPMERYQDGSNNLFNVAINPAFTSKLKADPVGQEVLDIYNFSGETKQAPKNAPRSIRITRKGHAEQLKLDAEQIGQYQQDAGQKTKAIFDKLIQMPEFQRLSREGKADIMSGVMTDVHTVSKMKLFGHDPDKPSQDVRALLKGKDNIFMNRVRKSVRKKLHDERY